MPAIGSVGTLPREGGPQYSSPLGMGRHQAQASRVDRNVAWKGKLTPDHCGQLWNRRRKEGPGLVTSREDQGAPPRLSQAARPYLPLGAPASTHTSLSSGSHTALGDGQSQVPIFQTRKLRLKKRQRLGISCTVKKHSWL